MRPLLDSDAAAGTGGRLARMALSGGIALLLTEIARRQARLSGPTWLRRNHRGASVSLIAGPVSAATSTLCAACWLPRRWRAPVLMLGLATAAVGLYDDIVGARPDQNQDKGFRGHVRAARAGRVSAGTVKLLGVVAASLGAAGTLSSGLVDRVVTGGVIAGTANLVNLFDLRPGRAAKVSALAGLTTLRGPAGAASAAAAGTALGVLPADLGEKVMLGDAGANALGALIGFRLAAGSGPAGRMRILVALVALTAASEKVSFTNVIETTPGLRELDRWGRLTLHLR